MPEDYEDLPSTLQRSPESARKTYAEAKESAEGTYGKGERASRTAYSALKHTHEKVGDHWEPKEEKGPSDSRAESGGANPSGEPGGGVDANASKEHLYERAQQLGVEGRSKMDKDELVDAIQKANDRETRKARGD
ncbi:ChaB family protein [Actinomycetospora callitridis]|jgi:ChaB/Rho termination factor, N-terminal domain|uniref:ChaB family protein n=1 Tax=Actinomycetospora callitridis TaxID=913944 RepID=UPI0023669241|nr:ChaB family protein [Actinomycetospora callitridis]MDD7919498.1 ChaB family protein [Actinomycetospora callitridis]